jgi:hypothetical protein
MKTVQCIVCLASAQENLLADVVTDQLLVLANFLQFYLSLIFPKSLYFPIKSEL